MRADPGEPTAVLIVRLWREAADGTALRARLLHSQDVEHQPPEVKVTSDPEELVRIVRAWLEQFLRS